MKMGYAMHILLVLCLVVTGCANSPDAPNQQTLSGKTQADKDSQPSELLDSTEFTLYGLSVVDKREKLIEKLGLPMEKYRENFKEDGDLFVYQYPRLEVFIIDERIAGFLSEDVELQTKQEIQVGDPFAEVVEAYRSFGIHGVRGGYFQAKMVVGAFVEGKENTLLFSFNYSAHDRPPKVETIGFLDKKVGQRLLGMVEERIALSSEKDWNLALKDEEVDNPEPAFGKYSAVADSDASNLYDSMMENRQQEELESQYDREQVWEVPAYVHVQLYDAVAQNRLEEAETLLAAGADPDQTTALLTAVQQNNVDMTILLLHYGANPNPELYHGSTPLSTAVWYDHLDMAQILLEAGAKPDMPAISELWIAVENGSWDMVQLLLYHGADPNLPGATDQTLLQVAHEKGFTEIAELLIKYGAFGLEIHLIISQK